MPADVDDRWERGDPYERYVGRWSRRVAPSFLAWLAMPPGLRWLDVGCGTGALSSAILDACAPAAVVGIEPSDGFLRTARERLGDRATLHRAHADAIPLADDSVDVAVSGLVLNFVSEPGTAVVEMKRVVRAGGTIAAYVWDYAGSMQLMRAFWDAAVALDPAAASLDEGVRFPICNADALGALFAGQRLDDVATLAVDIDTPFSSFDDYWQPFEGGQGPAPAYAMSLDATGRARLRDRIKARLPIAADGSIALKARAWAVRGTVPE